MNDWTKDVRYYLMPARHPVKGFEQQYHAAYIGWRQAWEKFRTEIGVKDHLSSDGFVLPDEIGALFYKGQFVGMSAFTYGSLEQGPTPDLSWFHGWTPEAYHQLQKISNNTMIGSQFTVTPEFTGKNQLIRWKDIVFLYTFLRFEASVSDVMAGHLNLTRKVNEACGEDSGATVLDPCCHFSYYGVDIPAQLVAYERENIHKVINKHSPELCQKLWSKLEHLSDYPIISKPLPFKKAA